MGETRLVPHRAKRVLSELWDALILRHEHRARTTPSIELISEGMHNVRQPNIINSVFLQLIFEYEMPSYNAKISSLHREPPLGHSYNVVFLNGW